MDDFFQSLPVEQKVIEVRLKMIRSKIKAMHIAAILRKSPTQISMAMSLPAMHKSLDAINLAIATIITERKNANKTKEPRTKNEGGCTDQVEPKI